MIDETAGFHAVVSGATAWPLADRAQQRSGVPLVAFISAAALVTALKTAKTLGLTIPLTLLARTR